MDKQPEPGDEAEAAALRKAAQTIMQGKRRAPTSEEEKAISQAIRAKLDADSAPLFTLNYPRWMRELRLLAAATNAADSAVAITPTTIKGSLRGKPSKEPNATSQHEMLQARAMQPQKKMILALMGSVFDMSEATRARFKRHLEAEAPVQASAYIERALRETGEPPLITEEANVARRLREAQVPTWCILRFLVDRRDDLTAALEASGEEKGNSDDT
jgi:hypothetical protein